NCGNSSDLCSSGRCLAEVSTNATRFHSAKTTLGTIPHCRANVSWLEAVKQVSTSLLLRLLLFHETQFGDCLLVGLGDCVITSTPTTGRSECASFSGIATANSSGRHITSSRAFCLRTSRTASHCQLLLVTIFFHLAF